MRSESLTVKDLDVPKNTTPCERGRLQRTPDGYDAPLTLRPKVRLIGRKSALTFPQEREAADAIRGSGGLGSFYRAGLSGGGNASRLKVSHPAIYKSENNES